MACNLKSVVCSIVYIRVSQLAVGITLLFYITYDCPVLFPFFISSASTVYRPLLRCTIILSRQEVKKKMNNSQNNDENKCCRFIEGYNDVSINLPVFMSNGK